MVSILNSPLAAVPGLGYHFYDLPNMVPLSGFIPDTQVGDALHEMNINNLTLYEERGRGNKYVTF